MDHTSIAGPEKCVNEGSFWHTNLDLYFGYQAGEVVEIEHEPNKYWLAVIRYSFKQLLSLDWLGDYGNFWLDLSAINASSSALTISEGYYKPRRLFPLGYHLQSQLRSQFSLVKPSKVLIKPTLYDPNSDPYGHVNNIEDLLSLHQDDINPKDKFGNQTPCNINETNNLGLKNACRAQISYHRQEEDAEELEAALHNLNGGDAMQLIDEGLNSESALNELNISSNEINPDDKISNFNGFKNVESNEQNIDYKSHDTNSKNNGILTDNQPPSTSIRSDEISIDRNANLSKQNDLQLEKSSTKSKNVNYNFQDDYDLEILNKCKNLQQSAMANGTYKGLGIYSEKIFQVKPKQIYDIGGANHERLIVPGTLFDVCNIVATSDEAYPPLEFNHWLAVVLKNNGGLLTLRWFLCDEPRFKQGRLELKSCRSQFIREQSLADSSKDEHVELVQDKSELEANVMQDLRLSSKEITFTMHFCDARISSISQNAKSSQKAYKMPKKLISIIKQLSRDKDTESIQKSQIDYVYDARRMNLDKDRPLIDHLYKIIDRKRPKYVNLEYSTIIDSNGDLSSSKGAEVLISTPRHIKLLRGFIKYELAPGVYEIHSEPVNSSGKFIKFVYPYDSSFSVLPMSWLEEHEDCVAPQTSRTSSPNFLSQISETIDDQDKKIDLAQSQLDFNMDLTPVSSVIRDTVDAIDMTKPCEDKQISNSHSDNTDCDPMKLTNVTDVGPKDNPNDIQQTFNCRLDESHKEFVLSKYQIMHQLEVLHHSGIAQIDTNVCQGRIRKVVYPLLWIQISPDSFSLLPFNSTSIYPSGWASSNDINLISLLPPLRKFTQKPLVNNDRKRKKLKLSNDKHMNLDNNLVSNSKSKAQATSIHERDELDLDSITDKPLDISFLLKDDIMFDKIYFNHKCFTGPSLSKGKICSLPQYVGPGPLRLVLEEVVTKIISVAYVPPRILNDLSSKIFEDLLISKNLVNTIPIEFKAKYQKRTHREEIQVCVDPKEVALYCECICEHLKCCYNLFGPNLYDGDDCPGHCRALTKSNKFMKRATYYREKARLGEFTTNEGSNVNTRKYRSHHNSSKDLSPTISNLNSDNIQPRSHEDNPGSTGTSSSSSTKSDNFESRPASSFDETPTFNLRENPDVLSEEELDYERQLLKEPNDKVMTYQHQETSSKPKKQCLLVCIDSDDTKLIDKAIPDLENLPKLKCKLTDKVISTNNLREQTQEFHMLSSLHLQPYEWSIDDVIYYLEYCQLHKFKSLVVNEHIDGQALLLLDRQSIKEHFQNQPKKDLSLDEIAKFYRFVEYVKTHIGITNI